MDTKAVRIYGKKDLRLETITLPPVGDVSAFSENPFVSSWYR